MSSGPDTPPKSSAPFIASEALRNARSWREWEQLSPQDVNEMRLLLRGDSVIDWHRLDFTDPSEVRRLVALNGLDLDDPDDVLRLQALRGQAVRYIQDTLRLKLSSEVADEVSPTDLFLIASGQAKGQRQACLLLKVMHILYHLDARELR